MAFSEKLNNTDCLREMRDEGIDLENFGMSVAHGIHSLSVEYVNHYFGSNITEDNAIPTVNTNLTGKSGM